MRTRALTARTGLLTAGAVVLSALWGCGGPQIPEHDGYRENWVVGWKKPSPLEFDEDFEAEIDGELSYAKRRRARWFAVDLPDDGTIDILLNASPLGAGQGGSDFDDMDVDVEDPFDVGFEVFNESFKILARADRDEQDVGERRKSRTLSGLPRGRYLVHLFLQRRVDEAEFFLRVKFRRGSADVDTGFPRDVQYVHDLPVVPAFDDAPVEPPRRRSTTRRSTSTSTRPPANKPADKPAAAGAMKARIIVIRGTSGGTSITLNRGTAQGVEPGWKGVVVTKAGTAIEGGSFTITAVKANSSTAQVSAAPDSVKQAGNARLRP